MNEMPEENNERNRAPEQEDALLNEYREKARQFVSEGKLNAYTAISALLQQLQDQHPDINLRNNFRMYHALIGSQEQAPYFDLDDEIMKGFDALLEKAARKNE